MTWLVVVPRPKWSQAVSTTARWPMVALGRGVRDFGLVLFVARFAVAARDRMLDRFDFQVRGDVFDDALAPRVSLGEFAAATGARGQWVDDDAVDAFGFGPAVPLVAGLGTGLLRAGFGGRFGAGRPGARRRVRPRRHRDHRDGGRKLEQQELDFEGVAGCEFRGPRVGQGAAAKRGQEGGFECGRRGRRWCGQGPIGLPDADAGRQPDFK